VAAATFACLPDPEEVRQASKRRRPPPSPSVSQMAWSCDDTKVPTVSSAFRAVFALCLGQPGMLLPCISSLLHDGSSLCAVQRTALQFALHAPDESAPSAAETTGRAAQLVVSVDDSSIRVWDTRTCEQLYELRQHKGNAFVLECHPTDSRIGMWGAYDGIIYLFDLATGERLSRCEGVSVVR